MSRPKSTHSREHGQSAESDALAAYLDALMRPISGAGLHDPILEQPAFRQLTETFTCLPITVGAMTLAIPRDAVHDVLAPFARLPDDPSSRAPSWFAGHCRTASGRATLVDLAAIVAGEGRAGGNLQTAVVIGSERYALACDAAGATFDMHPAWVSWRTSRTRRPWLAGIDSQRHYPLLDIPALEQQLIVDEGALVFP